MNSTVNRHYNLHGWDYLQHKEKRTLVSELWRLRNIEEHSLAHFIKVYALFRTELQNWKHLPNVDHACSLQVRPRTLLIAAAR